MQKYHDEPKQYKGYLKSALANRRLQPLGHLTGSRSCGVRLHPGHEPSTIARQQSAHPHDRPWFLEAVS